MYCSRCKKEAADDSEEFQIHSAFTESRAVPDKPATVTRYTELSLHHTTLCRKCIDRFRRTRVLLTLVAALPAVDAFAAFTIGYSVTGIPFFVMLGAAFASLIYTFVNIGRRDKRYEMTPVIGYMYLFFLVVMSWGALSGIGYPLPYFVAAMWVGGLGFVFVGIKAIQTDEALAQFAKRVISKGSSKVFWTELEFSLIGPYLRSDIPWPEPDTLRKFIFGSKKR